MLRRKEFALKEQRMRWRRFAILCRTISLFYPARRTFTPPAMGDELHRTSFFFSLFLSHPLIQHSIYSKYKTSHIQRDTPASLIPISFATSFTPRAPPCYTAPVIRELASSITIWQYKNLASTPLPPFLIARAGIPAIFGQKKREEKRVWNICSLVHATSHLPISSRGEK